MKKLVQLYRLDLASKRTFLKYLVKRALHLPTSENEELLHAFYDHLIRFNGRLEENNPGNFVTRYADLGVTLKLRKRPSSDVDVFSQIYKLKAYQALVDAFQKHFPNATHMKCMDAGSNIGLTSVYLARFFPKAEFIAIEPDQSNFETMSFNLSANRVNVAEKVMGGLWSSNCSLSVMRDFRDKSDWSCRVTESTQPTSLRGYSVRSLMDRNGFEHLDILKMDIEGSEKQVLVSPTSDCSFLSQTKCVAIEIHDEFECRQAITDLLAKSHFELFSSGELTIGINRSLVGS